MLGSRAATFLEPLCGRKTKFIRPENLTEAPAFLLQSSAPSLRRGRGVLWGVGLQASGFLEPLYGPSRLAAFPKNLQKIPHIFSFSTRDEALAELALS